LGDRRAIKPIAYQISAFGRSAALGAIERRQSIAALSPTCEKV